MNENDPRTEHSLLRRMDDSSGQEEVTRAPKKPRQPPLRALCERCGGGMLSCLPYFSTGSGLTRHPFAEDVICNGCGHIAPPKL